MKKISMCFIIISLYITQPFAFKKAKIFRKQAVEYKTMRIVIQSKKAGQFETIRQKFITQVLQELKILLGQENASVFDLPSKELTKIAKVKLSRKKIFRSYIPEKTGIVDNEVIPDIIVFIKRFGVRKKTVGSTTMSGYTENKPQYFYREKDFQVFEFVYFVYDNRTGCIIGFDELSEMIEDDLNQKEIYSMTNNFCNHIISALVDIRN